MSAHLIDWIQDSSTLHRKVEILYVVDGYEVQITHDGTPVAGPWYAETLHAALELGFAHYQPTNGR